MASFSNTSLSPAEDGPEGGDMPNNASTPWNSSPSGRLPTVDIIMIFSCILITGLVGNGTVIFLLGFRIKRSPFTTYVLNLAVADFGVLLFGSLYLILLLTRDSAVSLLFLSYAIFMYVASQLLLTVISIDRCVSVLFPIWHRCHRPPRLSPIVCALIWFINCLLSQFIIFRPYYALSPPYWYAACSVLCLPLVTVSTIILLFKVSCNVRQPRRGRVPTIILLTLLFFLLFRFRILTLHHFVNFGYLIIYGYIGAALNSCVNPVIYYMVGRKKKGQQRQGLKVILQRAFKEEEEHREEGDTTAQTQQRQFPNSHMLPALPTEL